jgi:hypothetical protein
MPVSPSRQIVWLHESTYLKGPLLNSALPAAGVDLLELRKVIYYQPVTSEAIKGYLTASPFRPVNLITSSGKSYLVPHPDYLNFSPTGRTCQVFAADGEYFTTLDVLTITEVVPVKRRLPGKKKR